MSHLSPSAYNYFDASALTYSLVTCVAHLPSSCRAVPPEGPLPRIPYSHIDTALCLSFFSLSPTCQISPRIPLLPRFGLDFKPLCAPLVTGTVAELVLAVPEGAGAAHPARLLSPLRAVSPTILPSFLVTNCPRNRYDPSFRLPRPLNELVV